MSYRIDRFWAFAILFMNGWIFGLPVFPETIAPPFWLTPVQLVHGIFIYEMILMIYMGFLVVKQGKYLTIGKRDVKKIVFLIVGLGCLGMLSNLANFQPINEMGEAGRLFLFAAYFLLSIHWAIKYSPTFVLRSLLLGILCAGAINLYYSFTIRFTPFGGDLLFLVGQNGPGGYLGLSVVLSAWLMLERKTRLDSIIALASGGIGVFAASISYSKLSMLIAGAGLIAWGVVLQWTLIDPRSRRMTAVMIAVVLAIAFINHDRISQHVRGVNKFIDYKFSNLTMDHSSPGGRWQYFVITFEILLNHPLLGVGYGGFYDAATATESYESRRSADEDAQAGSRGESNPHNSFLYYTSANGLAGLLMTVLLFMMTLRAFRRTLSGRGVPGRVLWVCLVAAYFIYGMTLPTLFNTSVLYLPAAVAIVLTRQARSRPSPIQFGTGAQILSKVVIKTISS